MIDLFGSFVCFQTFRDKSFKLIGIDYSSDDETPRNLTFKELPEEFGKPADNYDWTDNSETGGEVDHDAINNYFTFTNNNTSTSVINLRVNVNLMYYSYDDIKWEKYEYVNSGRFDITLLPGGKVRLKAVNKRGDTTTFDIKNNLDGINISGNIQTLSAGDDYKN